MRRLRLFNDTEIKVLHDALVHHEPRMSEPAEVATAAGMARLEAGMHLREAVAGEHRKRTAARLGTLPSDADADADEAREEVARVLRQYAGEVKEGTDGPRDLDGAIDAIMCALDPVLQHDEQQLVTEVRGMLARLPKWVQERHARIWRGLLAIVDRFVPPPATSRHGGGK